MSSKKLGAMLDALDKQSLKIDRVAATVTKLNQEYDRMEAKILESFKKSELRGAKGARVSVSLAGQTMLSIEDYDKFIKYVVKKHAYDLFQNRVSITAWRERTEAGGKVPGLRRFDKVYLKLHRNKKGGA